MAHLPPTTFYRKYHALKNPPKQTRCALSTAEEGVIIEVIKTYSDRGTPVSREDLKDVVELMVSMMPEARHATIPFQNGRPGRKFIRGFIARHRSVLVYRRPLRQQNARFASVNVHNMTTHFAAVEALVKEHNID